MKIAFVVPCNDLSGGLSVVTEYGNRLQSRGHQVTVYYPKPVLSFKKKVRNLINRYLKGQRTHLDRFRGKLTSVPVWKADLFRTIDQVVVTSWETARWVADLNLSDTRVLYLIQGYEVWKSDPAAVDATFRFPFLKATVSTWLSELVSKKTGEDLPPVLPNGIEPGPTPGPVTGRFYSAGMVYSAIPNKGSENGLAVLWNLHRSDPTRRFAVFGSDYPDKPLPPGTDFWYRPSVTNIQSIYGRSKVWLVNSYREGFGLPALEAMNAGCAVISTDNLGVRDVIVSGLDGMIVPAGDVNGMTLCAEDLLKDEVRLICLSVMGRNKAQSFNWEVTLDRFENLLLTGRSAS